MLLLADCRSLSILIYPFRFFIRAKGGGAAGAAYGPSCQASLHPFPLHDLGQVLRLSVLFSFLKNGDKTWKVFARGEQEHH